MTVIIADIRTAIPNIIRHNRKNRSQTIVKPSLDLRNDTGAKNNRNNPVIINNHFLNQGLICGLLSDSFFGLTILPLIVIIIAILFYTYEIL